MPSWWSKKSPAIKYTNYELTTENFSIESRDRNWKYYDKWAQFYEPRSFRINESAIIKLWIDPFVYGIVGIYSHNFAISRVLISIPQKVQFYSVLLLAPSYIVVLALYEYDICMLCVYIYYFETQTSELMFKTQLDKINSDIDVCNINIFAERFYSNVNLCSITATNKENEFIFTNNVNKGELKKISKQTDKWVIEDYPLNAHVIINDKIYYVGAYMIPTWIFEMTPPKYSKTLHPFHTYNLINWYQFNKYIVLHFEPNNVYVYNGSLANLHCKFKMMYASNIIHITKSGTVYIHSHVQNLTDLQWDNYITRYNVRKNKITTYYMKTQYVTVYHFIHHYIHRNVNKIVKSIKLYDEFNIYTIDFASLRKRQLNNGFITPKIMSYTIADELCDAVSPY